MTRKLVIAALATAAIVLGAVVVQRLLLRDSSTESARDSAPRPAPVADAAVVSSAADAQPRSVERVVSEVDGKVERRDPDGTWRAVAPGTKLGPADRIRTGRGGRAVLRVDGSRVVVDEHTNLGMSRIEAAVSQVLLKVGRVSAEVRPGSGRGLRVRREGSDVAATTRAGTFSMLATTRGDTFVAAKKGSVNVRARDKTVEVEEGEQTSVAKGGAPTAPVKIPTSLFLKLSSTYAKSRTRRYVVRGKADPFSRITVDGIPVQVSATGEFSRIVTLREGFNKVKVESRSVGGTKTSKHVGVAVDTSGPKVRGKVDWDE